MAGTGSWAGRLGASFVSASVADGDVGDACPRMRAARGPNAKAAGEKSPAKLLNVGFEARSPSSKSITG